MHISKHLLTLSAVMLLGACTNTGQGVKGDLKDFAHWVNGKPSHMEKSFGKVPTGYAGQNRRVLKPQAEAPMVAAAPVQQWNDLGAYDSGMPPVGEDYNQSVTVYPVDGQPQYMDDGAYYQEQPVYDGQGSLVQQVYFKHGSSKLSKSDKESLKSFGKSLQNDGSVGLTVVGHASHRVNGVSDPMRKKEINFEMAQKRASAVTKTLQDAGVNPGWVETVSRGDEEPNANPGSMGQEAADRRAEVYLHEQTAAPAY